MYNTQKITKIKKIIDSDIKSINSAKNKSITHKSQPNLKPFHEPCFLSSKNNILQLSDNNFKTPKKNTHLSLSDVKNINKLILTNNNSINKSPNEITYVKIPQNLKQQLFKMSNILKSNIKLKINESLKKNRRVSAPLSPTSPKKIISTYCSPNIIKKSKKYKTYLKKNKKIIKKAKSKLKSSKSINCNKKTPKKEKKFRCLEHKNPLYDSLDDNECDEDDNNNFNIPIDSLIILIYDIFLTFCSYYSLIFTPIVLAKSNCFCIKIDCFQKFLNYFTDIIYILDIILNSFRCYYNYEMKIINNSKKILIHYIKKDLFFDLIEAIPIFSISQYICNKKSNFMCNQYSMSIKEILFKIANILKLLKILKVNNHRKNRVAEFLQNSIYFENAFCLFKSFFIYFLVLHLLICIHIFLGIQRYPNWILLTKNIDDNLLYKYISSFYFMITTMTTVGYGDILCISNIERIFQIILLTLGTILYSFLISKVGNYIRDQSHLQEKLEQDKVILEEIRAAYPEMSFRLYTKITRHLNSKFTKSKKTENSILLNSLPETIKQTIVFKINKKIIRNFKFFKKCHNSHFIMETLTYFSSIILKKGDVLIREGELINNIIFVNDGRLSLEATIDLNDPITSIENYLTKNFIDISKEEDKFRMDANKNDNTVVDSIITELSFDELKQKINSIVFDNTENTITDIDICEKLNASDILDRTRDNMLNEEKFKKNYHNLKILDIRKNEHFGDVYVFLQKPAPLTLKVKSKITQIFILPKINALALNQSYPNICRKIQNRSYHNLISIKYRTFNILKSFCESQIQLSPNDHLNLYNILDNEETSTIKNSNIKIKGNFRKSLKLFQNVGVPRFTNKRFSVFKMENNLVNKRFSEGNKRYKNNIIDKNVKLKRIKRQSLKERIPKIYQINNQVGLPPSLQSEKLSKLFNIFLSNNKNLNEYYEYISNSKSKKKVNSVTSLKLYRKLNYSSSSGNKRKISEIKSSKSKSKQNSQINDIIQDIDKKYSFIESSVKYSCSNFTSENKTKIFDRSILQSTFNESFEIKSSYKNINLLSDKKLINNEIYQNELNELIVKYFSNKKSNKSLSKKVFSFDTFKKVNTSKIDNRKNINKDNLDSSSEKGTLVSNIKILKLAVYDKKEKTLLKLKLSNKKLDDENKNICQKKTVNFSFDSNKKLQKSSVKSMFSSNRNKFMDDGNKKYMSLLRNKTHSNNKKNITSKIDSNKEEISYINLKKNKLGDNG